MRRRREEEPKEKVLEVDASMQGTLTFKDAVNLRINGRFEGKLQTKGILTIGAQAIVNADIIGESIIVAGKVTGDISAQKDLSLIAPACVVGTIRTPALTVAAGAIMEGYCNMLEEKPGGSPSEALTIEEVAQFLEVDKAVVVEWASAGKLPAEKDGNKWRFEKAKIEDWLNSERIK
ncbi:MAG: polymer-forming cytoskeletal protein [Omnitrophica bacterium]|nr:polymer-forming cytoskeletal protein [Candidatus Omnitrophota bacterium]